MGWERYDQRAEEIMAAAEIPGRVFVCRCWCGYEIKLEGGPGAGDRLEQDYRVHAIEQHADVWEELAEFRRTGVHSVFVDLWMQQVIGSGPQSGGDSAE